MEAGMTYLKEKRKEAIILLGNTGFGKSTFTNLLAGKTLRKDKIAGINIWNC